MRHAEITFSQPRTAFLCDKTSFRLREIANRWREMVFRAAQMALVIVLMATR